MQKARFEVRGSDHGRDARVTAERVRRGQWLGPAKKECLFLTNKATMLLKIKDRVYERSQTNPISAGRIKGGIGCGRLEAAQVVLSDIERRVVTHFELSSTG